MKRTGNVFTGVGLQNSSAYVPADARAHPVCFFFCFCYASFCFLPSSRTFKYCRHDVMRRLVGYAIGFGYVFSVPVVCFVCPLSRLQLSILSRTKRSFDARSDSHHDGGKRTPAGSRDRTAFFNYRCYCQRSCAQRLISSFSKAAL